MKSIDDIWMLYQSQGSQPYGEDVSQLQHAVQVARLAEAHGASDTLIAAALLHDIGHLFYTEEVIGWQLNDRHEILGAGLLYKMFGEAVAEPVKLHVMAKRYLCGINHAYYDGLTSASKESLEVQGGPLDDSHKRSAFERNQYFEQAIELRYWDDEGKNPGDLNNDFKHFLPLLNSLYSAT
jgi:predicted HD phosphohydrolase